MWHIKVLLNKLFYNMKDLFWLSNEQAWLTDDLQCGITVRNYFLNSPKLHILSDILLCVLISCMKVIIQI